MLLQDVRTILKKECSIRDESKLLIGVSGGPDSVCLLDILSQLPYEIIVGHLNHNLRPSSSEEMDFVEKLAEKYKCKFVGKSSNILEISRERKIGIEEAARKERYHFLFNSAEDENARAVLVAHQADDQIETLLENLIRGAGFEGMTGMKVKSFSEFNLEIPLVRPLLKTWRDEILKYCQSHHLEFRIDETNQSIDHTRSRIRNHLIPELSYHNPNIKRTLLRTQQVLAEDFDFLRESIASSMKAIKLTNRKNSVDLDIKEFKKLPVSLQRLVVKNIFEKYFFGQEIVRFSNIEYARKMFTRELKRTTLLISNQLFIYTTGEKGVLAKNSEGRLEGNRPRILHKMTMVVKSGKYPINEKWELEIEESPKELMGVDYYKNQDVFTAYFDEAMINESLSIRTWIKGDRFQPLGMNGESIKLSDYWINRKISPMERNDWPLILSEGKIIWVPGLQQNNETRITKKTQKIIILRMKRKPER